MSLDTISYIYTDGSCLKNPGGVGGWAFVLVKDDSLEIIGYGTDSETTNNRMELQAVIKALSTVEKGTYVINTDSLLTLNCATGLYKRKSNIDLWEEYDKACLGHNLEWNWVKAHNGNKYNELVDTIAREEAKKCEKLKYC